MFWNFNKTLFILMGALFVQTRDHLVFWRKVGKMLIAESIDTISIKQAEFCLGKCLQNHHCKSINVYNNNTTCALFSVDRCSYDVKWVDQEQTVYFDSIATEQCPPSKYYLIVLDHLVPIFEVQKIWVLPLNF